jgi:hypothetical protein
MLSDILIPTTLWLRRYDSIRHTEIIRVVGNHETCISDKAMYFLFAVCLFIDALKTLAY